MLRFATALRRARGMRICSPEIRGGACSSGTARSAREGARGKLPAEPGSPPAPRAGNTGGRVAPRSDRSCEHTASIRCTRTSVLSNVAVPIVCSMRKTRSCARELVMSCVERQLPKRALDLFSPRGIVVTAEAREGRGPVRPVPAHSILSGTRPCKSGGVRTSERCSRSRRYRTTAALARERDVVSAGARRGRRARAPTSVRRTNSPNMLLRSRCDGRPAALASRRSASGGSNKSYVRAGARSRRGSRGSQGPRARARASPSTARSRRRPRLASSSSL